MAPIIVHLTPYIGRSATPVDRYVVAVVRSQANCSISDSAAV